MSKYDKLFRVLPDLCWEWTGYITPDRQCRKIRYEPEKYNKIEDLGSHYTFVAKGQPRASYKGRSIAANRAVIADHMGLSDVKEIRSIKRICGLDRCVNPDHYQVILCEALPIPITVTLDMLLAADSDPAMGPMGAEIDLNLAPGSIPNELWIEYLAATEGSQDAPDA